jgi:hypothetical protein
MSKKGVQPIVDAVPLCVAFLIELPGNSVQDVGRLGSDPALAVRVMNGRCWTKTYCHNMPVKYGPICR